MTSTAPAQTVPSKASPTKTVASIRWLAAPTSWSWVEQANARPMEVLIDHAHCERKAAGAAVQMMFRYLCEPGLGEALSPLAREELEHFEQCWRCLLYTSPSPRDVEESRMPSSA